jgi:hypothetical protein
MAQSNNIIIGSPGAASETSTIRIGNTQTSAYVAGIYGESTGPNLAVYVDSNGELGTASSDIPLGFNTYPFLAYQVGQTTAVLGTGIAVPYWLGSNIAMTKLFDVGSNFTVGTGSGSSGKANGCYFTAPVTGIYQFMMNIWVDTQQSEPPGGPPNQFASFNSEIVTNANTYSHAESSTPGSGDYFPRYNNDFWFTFQATIPLTATNQVWFNTSCVIQSASASGAVYVGFKYNNIPPTTDPGMTTRISGFRVA